MAEGGLEGPSDADIEAALREVPPERWAALWPAAQAVAPGTGEHLTWRGGETSPQGVTHMPYPEYDAAADAFRAALTGVTRIVVFDWGRWGGLERYRGGTGLAEAPIAESVRLTTAIFRAERFSDGTIGAAFENGTFAAIVDALRAWHEANV